MKQFLRHFKNAFLLLLIVIFFSCVSEEIESSVAQDEIVINNTADFVGTETCISCHQKEHESWEGSHHDEAMKIANNTSVLGNFNGVTFSHKGIKNKFYKKNNDFYVNTIGHDGEYQDYKIKYTFGVYPLQQYLIEFPNGKVQCLLIAWDSKDKKWFRLQPDLDIHHKEWLHWTGGSMTWNTMCADCHSTNLKKNFNSKTEIYNTTFSEINVGCEACHGPASLHVSFYENPAKENSSKKPELYMTKGMGSKDVVQKCARCHSRREQITPYFDYEGHFLDHYNPSTIPQDLYELDGQIDNEDYVYSSFVQSKMYHNKVSCKDCHDVHSLKLKRQGNDLCMSCHKPEYNSAAHHFHEMKTDAAQCINCHMPGKLYMGNDFRRDHSFRVPRPDQSLVYGTPNACNGCHKDESEKWAADAILINYGPERIDHFSDHLLAGYSGNLSEFIALAANTKYPEIARARALNEFANHQLSNDEVSGILLFLNDTSALVRNEAALAIAGTQRKNLQKYIEPLLQDTIRLVRLAAAQYFNELGVVLNNNTAYTNAQKEYLESLDMVSDFAAGQLKLALYYQAKGDDEKAIIAYLKAIEIDNYFNPARMNLALIYYNQGKIIEAESLYLTVIEQEPEFGYAYYLLGLLYNETGEIEKALTNLKIASIVQPPSLKASYNYALLLQQKDDFKASNEVIENALIYFPDNEDLLYVKLLGELNTENYKRAKVTCSKLLYIDPDNRDYQQIFMQLRKEK